MKRPYSPFFEQDMVFVHEWLKVSKNGAVRMGNCQEIRSRQFQNTIYK
jgi:hypothetical protein